MMPLNGIDDGNGNGGDGGGGGYYYQHHSSRGSSDNGADRSSSRTPPDQQQRLQQQLLLPKTTTTTTTQLTIGQDLDSIKQYIDAFSSSSSSSSSRRTTAAALGQCPSSNSSSTSMSSLLPPPSPNPSSILSLTGVMFYTDIQTLKGMTTGGVDYGSGIEDLQSLKRLLFLLEGCRKQQQQQKQDRPPPYNIQIGLWLNGKQGCRDILSGGRGADTNTTDDSDGANALVVHDNVRKMLEILMTNDDEDSSYEDKKKGGSNNPPSTSTPQESEKGKANAKDDETDAMIHYYLRIGYEFDNPSFGYDDPSVYKKAFQKIVDTCHELYGVQKCRSKISFVWHSWAAPRTFPLVEFYPGDDYVDWVGVSIFQQVYPWANNNSNDVDANNLTQTEYQSDSDFFAGGTLRQVHEVLEFAKLHNKPVMIAESTPFGGIHGEDFDQVFGHLPSYQKYKSSLPAEPVVFDTWTLWFEPVLKLIHEYDVIQMWSYINCEWDVQPMWKNIGFGDTRLSSSKSIQQKWIDNVLCNPRFASVSAPAAASLSQLTSKGVTLAQDQSSSEQVTTISARFIFTQSMMSNMRFRPRYGDTNNDAPQNAAPVCAVAGISAMLLLCLFMLIVNIQRRHRKLRCQSDHSSRIHKFKGVVSYGSLD